GGRGHGTPTTRPFGSLRPIALELREGSSSIRQGVGDIIAAMPQERRLAAILVADVVGYSRLVGADESGTLARLAALRREVAEPRGIALSRQVHDQVRDRIDAVFEDRGEIKLKNIARPVHVFALAGRTIAAAPAPAPALPLPDKPSIAVLPFQNMSGDPEQD